MRGGIPLIPRSCKKRSNRNRKQAAARKLRTGVAFSILFLCASQQVGSTYGGFTGDAELESSISFCAVFPDTAKQQLLAFKDHIQRAAALLPSLKGSSSIAGGPAISGIEGMTLEELDAAEQELAGRVSSLQAELNAADEALAANSRIWSEINAELNAAAAALSVFGGYMHNLDRNCLQIKDTALLDELQNSFGKNGMLSDSLSASLSEILRYVRDGQIQASPFSATVTGIVYGEPGFGQPELQQTFPLLLTLQGGNVSGNLTAIYDGYTAEWTQAKDSAAAAISALDSQRALIGEARAKRLEELEQARIAELEQAKQAETEKLAAEELAAEQEDGDTGSEPEPSPEVEPTATPAPEATPTAETTEAPASGEAAPEEEASLAAENDNAGNSEDNGSISSPPPAEETATEPTDEPAATPAPEPEPSPTPVPSPELQQP